MAEKLDKRSVKVLVALGRHIRAVREDRDVQQAQLARAISMEPTNLAKIERGEKNVTVDTLVRIATGLGTDLSVELSRRGSARTSAGKRGA